MSENTILRPGWWRHLSRFDAWLAHIPESVNSLFCRRRRYTADILCNDVAACLCRGLVMGRSISVMITASNSWRPCRGRPHRHCSPCPNQKRRQTAYRHCRHRCCADHLLRFSTVLLSSVVGLSIAHYWKTMWHYAIIVGLQLCQSCQVSTTTRWCVLETADSELRLDVIKMWEVSISFSYCK